MQPTLVLLLIAALAAVAIASAVIAHRQARQRREALSALAASLGWSFDPSKDTSHDDRYAHFEVFRRGHSRAAYNTMEGSAEVAGRQARCQMGDFTYKVTRQNGKSTSTTTYRFSYLILHLPFAAVPDLLIRREGVFDKLAGAFGFDDIDFESAEFSRAFHVKSPDKRFAYDVVHPRMMEFLMQGRGPAVDIEQGRCCLADGRSLWTPQEFKRMLGWAAAFFDLWPEHVRRDIGAAPPLAPGRSIRA